MENWKEDPSSELGEMRPYYTKGPEGNGNWGISVDLALKQSTRSHWQSRAWTCRPN